MLSYSPGGILPESAVQRFRRIVFVCVAMMPVFLFAAARPVMGMDTSAMPATELMRMLPTSIFDNTTEPVSQDSLELLLSQGWINSWIVVENKQDRLRMTATGDSPEEVQVQVLRTAPSGIVILGARTNDSCATELWSYNERGWLMPYSGPQEPAPQEFFASTRHLPRGLVYSCRMCLERGMLEAVPWFWNASDASAITPDNRIFYIWNGREFVQRVLPAADAGDLPSLAPLTEQPPTGSPFPGGGHAGQ